MAKTDPVLAHMREICLSLPDTKETLTWGKPHFRVADRIFAGCGEENGIQVIGFKLEMAHADVVVQDPRFWRAPYVGHKGWVSMVAASVKNWDEVRQMVLESYRLIAPKRTLAKLDSGAAVAPALPKDRDGTARRKFAPVRRAGKKPPPRGR